ncbi:arginase [Porphyromonas levii]|uniref:arginase n=1 Tax=Porphyromonas levii TaxID=28114 RepID=UPI001B8BF725|nr:arginase [Porphyromonas levii]MBR8769045.1 Arginase [Porphyromonas levii]
MKTFDIIGFPINLGCDKDGTESSPSYLRKSGCLTSIRNQVNDLGDLPCPPRMSILEEKYASHPKIKFLSPILQASQPLADKVAASIRNNHIPVCIGGDHVMAFGSIAGVGLAKGKDNYAVIYIDAHGDFNTGETSGTGNMHGMHLSFLMGKGEPSIANYWGTTPLLDANNIYFLGARALDEGEKQMAKEMNLYVRTSEDLNLSTPYEIVNEVIEDIKKKGITHIHLSFDVDVIDPRYAPGTGVPESDGIMPALAYELIHLCEQSGLVRSVDVVEFNKNLDKEFRTKAIVKQVLKIIFN